MKAVSVRQPWAAMIAQGHKPIETRTWSTRHRGELLIVASRLPRFIEPLIQCPHCYEFYNHQALTPHVGLRG